MTVLNTVNIPVFLPSQHRILRIALPVPLYHHFDYLPPIDCPVLHLGQRVKVPFGRRSLIGILTAINPPNPHPYATLKPATAILDEAPLIDDHLLTLLTWASQYYHYPLGEVLNQALPKPLREGKSASPPATPTLSPLLPETPLLLSPDQAQAVEHILSHPGFQTFVLEGITGSGKTEVYLQTIAHLLPKQVLVIVPEISLTPQTISRFQKRFPQIPMATLHSQLTEKQRKEAWLLAKSGQVQLIIGTRSAIFTPLLTPGLIILDEEHDSSFKQQSGFRYHTRDLAIKRAQLADCPIILGSATPSLEVLKNVQEGKFRHLLLRERAANAKPPKWHLIDLRQHPCQDSLSDPLLTVIGQHLSQGNQVLIFRNRRGFAATLFCQQCRWLATCDRCSVRLTLHHHPKQLVCHHCGHTRTVPSTCPSCSHPESLIPLGTGTMRLEAALANHFPTYPLVRIDRDSIRKKGELQSHLENIHQGNHQLMIGTQMLAKGHHFPNLTLVALIDFDEGLFSSDFRATEKMAQLLLQVAGRAGRAEKPGEVWIQTYFVEHPLFQTLPTQSYGKFAQSLLKDREALGLPPYGHLALFRAEAPQSSRAQYFLNQLRDHLSSLTMTTELLGPTPSLIAKKAGLHRWQLLLLDARRSTLHQLLNQAIPFIQAQKGTLSCRWSLEVDPIDLS